MHATDPFERLFESLPAVEAPEGFEQRLMARLAEERMAQQKNVFRVSGLVCIASALTMFIVLHSPLTSLIPQVFEVLRGVLQ